MDTSNSLMAETRKVRHSMISTLDRKRILIFVAVVYGITSALAVVIFLNGGLYTNNPESELLVNLLMVAIMFAPAIANIVTRLITREGWSHTYLRPNLSRGWPYYLAALSLPILAIILGGVIYYLLFQNKFDLSMQWARGTDLIPPWLAKDPWWVIFSQTVLSGYRTVLISVFLMLGEEFGWRAYLLPKLMPIGSRKAVLLTGVIWAVFHWPMIFMGYQYRFGYWGAPVVGPLVWVLVTMLGINTLLAWLTLRTSSVWPAAIAHGVGNSIGPLMVFFHQGEWDRLIGPSTVGIVGCMGYALLTMLFFLSPRTLALTASPRTIKPEAVQTVQQPAG